ncbi:condensin complex subunit 1 [Agrilus planipennis]|uniref:Condensin complex subunit 1 n=1 Tax=Agrilus planipennis TaxID=224129 RepID=A0A1W4WVY4_AGRPL|nr:condensin complex subunit 1 [Agrilus planipennis]
MAHINFVIPQTKNDLLSHESDQYFVRDVIGPKEIYSKLKVAKQCLRDEGPDFILDNFDVYFSIFLRPESHTMDNMMMGYLDLHKAVTDLNKNIGFILEDKESLNDEIKAKYQNILKMLLYAYTNLVITIEHTIDIKRQNMLQSKTKGKKKGSDSSADEGVNKKGVVLALNNILDREISFLWDPPVVEEVFINMVSEVFYRFLEFPTLKSDRELRTELFNAIGILLKRYNHGMTFNVRITQLIKMHEHLMFCIPEGIQLLVNDYNCKGLVRNFIREITEWQTDEKFQDSQSYTLRNSVLSVIAEVVLTVLSKDNLNEEEKDSRDELLEILEDHIFDTSSFVRTKVVQHWAKLQKENAIPLSVQNSVLEKIVGRLYDKGANVRKSAANCVSTFLTHNIYGAELQLSKMEKELQQKRDELDRCKGNMCQNTTNKLQELDNEWTAKVEKLKEVIAEKLQEEQKEEENDEKDEEKNLALEDGIPALIRQCITEEKFDEAFKMCRLAVKHLDQWKESSKNLDKREEGNLFLVLMKTVFYGQGSRGTFVDLETNFKVLEKLESHVQFLTNCVGFLQQINKAIRPMKELLESTSIGDMQEAVDFFVIAFQFKIENALDGILAMLRIMQRNEQERKEYVVNAFKTIYLTTDTKSMKEHTTTIVDRLIHLLKTTPYDSLNDFSIIVTEWTSKGILDNSVIDALWQCFTKQRDVSEDDSRAAIDLLAMAAKGRKTIISKNLKMIATVAFTERGEKDLLLLASACRLMAIAGMEKQNITDKNPPFRIKTEDPIWKDLMSILEKTFFNADPFYPTVISAAAELIYRLCSKPEQLWEEFIYKMVRMVVEKFKGGNELPRYIIIQCGHLFGEVAIKELHFLDEAIYKELKRRQFIRDEKNDKQRNKRHNRTILANASSSRRKSRISSVDTVESKVI